MFVAYTWCKAFDHIASGEFGLEREREEAGYVVAWDNGQPEDWEYEGMLPNECIWIVPGTL